MTTPNAQPVLLLKEPDLESMISMSFDLVLRLMAKLDERLDDNPSERLACVILCSILHFFVKAEVVNFVVKKSSPPEVRDCVAD